MSGTYLTIVPPGETSGSKCHEGSTPDMASRELISQMELRHHPFDIIPTTSVRAGEPPLSCFCAGCFTRDAIRQIRDFRDGNERRRLRRSLPVDFRYAPFATEVLRRCEMSPWGTTAAVSAFVRDDELYASATDTHFFGPITNHVAILPFPLTSIGPRLSNSNLSLTRSYVSVET